MDWDSTRPGWDRSRIRLPSGPILSWRSSPSSVSPSCRYGAGAPTGAWIDTQMLGRGREAGGTLAGVGVHAPSTGLHGASRSTAPPSTHSWISGTLTTRSAYGRESASTQHGGAFDSSREVRRTPRGRLERNGCESRARRPDFRHRALRVLPTPVRAHSLRRCMERQRAYRQGIARASAGRQRAASP